MLGKSKGLKQILYERGLYKASTKVKKYNAKTHQEVEQMVTTTRANYFEQTLANCDDFKAQKGALQLLFESRGHLLIMSPKYHPELAGCGIEYAWGKAKLEFRRHFNDTNAGNLKKNVLNALQQVDLDMSRRFARRARDYMRVYDEYDRQPDDKNREEGSYTLYERMKKEQKAHRCIMTIDMSFINAE